jgi:hypothetical protein
MTIPKIIWAIWCNFNAKTDGVLDEKITYFYKRIKEQHPVQNGWTVNVITKWQDLMEHIKDDRTLTEIINNPHIGAAHKSDAIRFYLLNIHGGFWIDISTFLFTSLDIYYTECPDADFIGYYTPAFMIEQVILSSLNQMMDSVKYTEATNKIRNHQSSFIHLNEQYAKFPYIPENFFIASVPGHYLVADVYQQLMTFWTDAMPSITNNDTLCFALNQIMNNFATEMFVVNDVNYKLYTAFSPDDITDPKFTQNLLKNIWACGYLFNYLQMYKALNVFNQDANIEFKRNPEIEDAQANAYKRDICPDEPNSNHNACDNIIIRKPNSSTAVYLFSLSHNRLSKWADTMDLRINFETTYIQRFIDSHPGQDISQHMIQLGIYQIKFSSWSRHSRIIPVLMKLYPNKTEGGRTKRFRRKSKRTQRRHKRRTRKIYI